MKVLSMQAGCAMVAAAALLAGCGGGGGGDDGGSASAGGGSQVPASALQSSEGLAAFQSSLNNNGTDSTSAPLILGTAPLPTSDTAPPIAVN